MTRPLVLVGFACLIACSEGTQPGIDTSGPGGTLPPSAAKIAIAEFSPRLYRVGGQIDLDALIVPDSTSAGLTWASSDASVIRVEGAGASALKAGTATLTASVGGVSNEVALTVIVPFAVEPLLQAASSTSIGISGMSETGAIVGSRRVSPTTLIGFVVKGATVTELDCLPRDINNLDAILCTTGTTNLQTTVRRPDGATIDVTTSGYEVLALNDSGDVSLLCYLSCSSLGGVGAVGVRLASGTVISKAINEMVDLSAGSFRGFNNAGDVGLAVGALYSTARIYSRSTNALVQVPGGFGRWSRVTAINENRDAVTQGEGPAGSNISRPVLLTFNGSGWTRVPIGSKGIDVVPYVVGFSGSPTDLNCSREVIGSGSGNFGPFFWTNASRGGPSSLDSLLADPTYTILSAAKITFDRRIAAMARNKTTGEHWLVRLSPQQ